MYFQNDMGFSFLLCFVVNLILGDRKDPMILMQMPENTCTQKNTYIIQRLCVCQTGNLQFLEVYPIPQCSVFLCPSLMDKNNF